MPFALPYLFKEDGDNVAYFGPSSELGEIPNSYQEAVAKCALWFDKDRTAKQFYTDEMREMYKLYNCKHWDLTGPTGLPLRTPEQQRAHPNNVEPITFALIEGIVSEFSQEVDLIDIPVEPGDDEIAKKLSDLKEFIAYKNRLKREREKFLRNFFLYGTGIWHIFWDPNWHGGRGPNRWVGDIRWISLSPQAAFPDARCKESIEEGSRFHKAMYRTIEYIKENYPEYGHLVQPDIVNSDFLISGDDTDQESMEANEEQVLLVETWYKGRPLILDEGEEDLGPGLHVIWWAGEGQRLYLRHANYVYFDPEEEAKFPFVFAVRYPRQNSVWGHGDAYFLKSPQIVLNKTSELILEAHIQHALGQTYYNESAVTPQQRKQLEQWGTLGGMHFPVRDVSGIKRFFGESAPASLQNEVVRLQKLMETVVGRFDVSQGRTPGSVTAFRALDLLAARAQVRLRSAEETIAASYEEAGKYINHLIQKFYTERRMYRILNKRTQAEGQPKINPTYGSFMAEDIRKVYVFGTNESIPMKEAVIPPEWQEGEDYEIYSPEFDVMCRTTTKLPTDRIFYMEMAKELFGAQLIDKEIFWYVMEHGKFPPWEELKNKSKLEDEQALAQAGLLPGGPAPGGPGGQGPQLPTPPGLPPGQVAPPQGGQPPSFQLPDFSAPNDEAKQAVISAVMNRPDLQQQLAMLSPEEQRRLLEQIAYNPEVS